ncbi:MAG: GNAT family protein [Bacillota bacterium]|nr:GNAT family protein [Bacillota bacterium]
MGPLTTKRLLLRELGAQDLESVLPVFTSNSEYLLMTEGATGTPGYYDLGMLQRDWQIAQQMPGRHMLGAYARGQRDAVAVADFMEASPYDGLPWLGLVEVHRAYQGKGYGGEVMEALLQHFQSEMQWARVRAAVSSRNDGGLAFARRYGFAPYGYDERRSPAGVEQVILLEKIFRENV